MGQVRVSDTALHRNKLAIADGPDAQNFLFNELPAMMNELENCIRKKIAKEIQCDTDPTNLPLENKE